MHCVSLTLLALAPTLPSSLAPQLPSSLPPMLALEGYQALYDARLPGTERVRVLLKMLNDRYVPLEVSMELIEKDGERALSNQRSAYRH